MPTTCHVLSMGIPVPPVGYPGITWCTTRRVSNKLPDRVPW